MRLIPSILLNDDQSYKSKNFKIIKYFGDPINLIRNISEFPYDEVLISYPKNKINKKSISFLQKLSKYSKIPLCYAGNIRTRKQVLNILSIGYEKVAINYFSYLEHKLYNLEQVIGSQSIVLTLNIKKIDNEYYLINLSNPKDNINLSKIKDKFFEKLKILKFGELLLNDIDLDGSQLGYDVSLIEFFYFNIDCPLLIQGGSKSLKNCKDLSKKFSDIGFVGSSLYFLSTSKNSFLINDLK